MGCSQPVEGESACLSLLLSNKHLELEVGDEVAVITRITPRDATGV